HAQFTGQAFALQGTGEAFALIVGKVPVGHDKAAKRLDQAQVAFTEAAADDVDGLLEKIVGIHQLVHDAPLRVEGVVVDVPFAEPVDDGQHARIVRAEVAFV